MKNLNEIGSTAKKKAVLYIKELIKDKKRKMGQENLYGNSNLLKSNEQRNYEELY